ncbi:MAG: LssY C-terminal domain-containing protein [Planctomycetia bacterium]|nr:LssY C-terminal domain-containing protein [Planctomycetia bacterium]
MRQKRRLADRLVIRFLWLACAYVVVAYLVLPRLWQHYEHQPDMADAPKTTVTHNDIPGDPLNVGLVGTKEEVIRALVAAKWQPADPVTLKSSMKIAASVLLDRRYADAPVSSLYVWGRKQDLAFEQPVGKSAKHRHHVRFWQRPRQAPDRRPMWLGAATFDKSVGLSHRTGQITHHIDADVDAERDHIINSLIDAEQLDRTYEVSGVGPTVAGRNGGGDWYYTDGELMIGDISPGNVPVETAPVPEPDPPMVKAKNRFWTWLRGWLK